MTAHAHILTAIQREFPAPLIDPAWVEECAAALLDDGQDASLENIRDQYLFSDLSTSTTGDPVIPSEAHNVELFPTRTLVQLVSITEIGSSAFQLQTVLEQRKEVLSGATRIRRMDDEDGEDGADGEEIDDGRLPKYPRGMLRMEVTDGRRVMRAMEYKRLVDLQLGETRLGSKLVLHRVRALRGTLLLSPDNTSILGYENAILEAEQPTQFVNSLLRRMGKPVQVGENDAPAAPSPPRRALPPPAVIPHHPAPAATPARRLTLPPPPAPRDENGASVQYTPRARVAATTVASPYFSTSTGRAGPSNGPDTSAAAAAAAPPSSTRPSRTARAASQERITTLYDQTAELRAMASGSPAINTATYTSSTARARAVASSGPSLAARGAAARRAAVVAAEEEQGDESFDYDDSFLQQVEAVEAAVVSGRDAGVGAGAGAGRARAGAAVTTGTNGSASCRQVGRGAGGGGQAARRAAAMVAVDDEDDVEMIHDEDDDSWFDEVDVEALEMAHGASVPVGARGGRGRGGEAASNGHARGAAARDVRDPRDKGNVPPRKREREVIEISD